MSSSDKVSAVPQRRGFLEQIAEARKITIAQEDPAYSIESLNKICK